MNLKKILVVSLILGCCASVYGQEFEIVELVEKTQDQSAQIHQRKDGNGNSCALVRVLLNEPGAKFEGSYVVGEAENFTGGYNVYLASGGKKFTIKHEKALPIDVSVSNFGIKSFVSNKTYEMSVVIKESELGMLDDTNVDDLTSKAEQGDKKAQHQLAKMYANGIDVEQDYDLAVKWYQKSAENGNVDALYDLGMCYYYGQGVNQNYTKALELLTKAANSENKFAQFRLGVMYDKGEGVTQNMSKSVSWYNKSAKNGYSFAMNNLANALAQGSGIEKDEKMAFSLYQRWYRNSTV